MPRYEVFCPASPPEVPADVTVRVDAEHWLAALRAALQKVGGPEPGAHLLCDVQQDGTIQASDPGGGGVYRIRELSGEPASPGRPRGG